MDCVVIFDLSIGKLILIISKSYVRNPWAKASLLHVSLGSTCIKHEELADSPAINFYLHSKTFLINSTIMFVIFWLLSLL